MSRAASSSNARNKFGESMHRWWDGISFVGNGVWRGSVEGKANRGWSRLFVFVHPYSTCVKLHEMSDGGDGVLDVSIAALSTGAASTCKLVGAAHSLVGHCASPSSSLLYGLHRHILQDIRLMFKARNTWNFPDIFRNGRIISAAVLEPNQLVVGCFYTAQKSIGYKAVKFRFGSKAVDLTFSVRRPNRTSHPYISTVLASSVFCISASATMRLLASIIHVTCDLV